MASGFGSRADDWVSREVEAMAAAWNRGEQILAADLIEAHPDLESDAALRLIYEETSLRREAGHDVQTSEVVGRYPRWEKELRALLECDRLLRPSMGSVDDLTPGEQIGPFNLLKELGRGVSGRTFLATDPTLADRLVVVKVVSSDEHEHLALAPLRHTHIVPLFSEHAYPERGLRVLCMPDLGGSTLSRVLEKLADRPASQRTGRMLVEAIESLRIDGVDTPTIDGPYRAGLEQSSYERAIVWISACLADALQHAHARDIVHMDLKPSNVLITADGQPMLLDFHLARPPIQAGEQVAGRIGGTRGWMSPEQDSALSAVALGQPVPNAVDGRSDLYALGLLLRAALGPDRETSVGISDIVRKCVEHNPAHRYQSAGALGEDLRRHLQDLPLRGVRNRSWSERSEKWRRRNPGAMAWGFAGLVAMITICVAISARSQRLAEARADLTEGIRAREAGDHRTSLDALDRGLSHVERIPWSTGMRNEISSERDRTRRARLADELHELADLVRFRFGVDLPPAAEARALERVCQTVWENRSLLVPAMSNGTGRLTALQIKQDLVELAAARADFLAALGSSDEALRFLDEATSTLGPSQLLTLRRSSLLGEDVEIALKSSEQTPAAVYDIARYLLRSGRFEESEVAFRRVLKDRPQDFWPNFYQGNCAFRLGRHNDAVEAFRSCIALQPDAAFCRYDRGLALDALGRTEEAREDYTQALKLDPFMAEAALNRGILDYRERQFGRAIDDFRCAIRAKPDRLILGRTYYNLALAQLAIEDRESGEASLEAAIGLGSTEAEELRRNLR
jgi:eukaryotic-like serine/threonine-protein kinase